MSHGQLTRLETTGAEYNPPDAQGTAESLRRMGHSIEDALAEIVDNSLEARASQILIRFFRQGERILRVAIADDGVGMDEAKLKRSMQYGVRQEHAEGDLGKYGIGLKTASFSQCSEITVVSKSARSAPRGRRWTQGAIASEDWRQHVIAAKDCRTLFDEDWAGIDVQKSGTIVVWDDLDSAALRRNASGSAFEKFFDRLATALGLTFHRFIEEDGVSIALDVADLDSDEASIAREVLPLNPFSYSKTGHAGYPLTFRVRVPHLGEFRVEGHIWPPLSKDANYKLGGGRVSSRQGFYVYRNRRLINAGGWFGLRGDSEPHGSLARVKFDLPPRCDSQFHLSVQKNRVEPPEEFLQALEQSKAGRTSFTDYLQDAQSTYRNKPRASVATIVAGTGGPRALPTKRDSNEKRTIRAIAFSWVTIKGAKVVEISRDRQTIRINRKYRKHLQDGNGARGDAAVFKILLLHALDPHLRKLRVMEAEREALSRINAELLHLFKR